MRGVGAHACTDVTGFGLLGHLHEMTTASGVGALVRLGDVPLIEGTRDLLKQDMAPGGTWSNMEFLDADGAIVWGEGLSEEDRLALCDAQTAGGLLISVAPDRVGELLDNLKAAEVSEAVEIVEIITDLECRIRVEV